jgi:hypothetical protein
MPGANVERIDKPLGSKILPIGKDGIFSGKQGDPVAGVDQMFKGHRLMIDHC